MSDDIEARRAILDLQERVTRVENKVRDHVTNEDRHTPGTIEWASPMPSAAPSPLAAAYGKWPGDETDEELAAAMSAHASGPSSCDASDEKRADAWLLPVWETMPDRVYTPTVLLLAELLADVRRVSVEAAISAFHDACTDDPHVLEQAMRGSLFTRAACPHEGSAYGGCVKDGKRWCGEGCNCDCHRSSPVSSKTEGGSDGR